MSIATRLDSVGKQIGILATRLVECAYRFERPDAALPGPESGTEAAIARIERDVGELPLALKLFWHQIGGVDFCGSHPEWAGCDYPDPLVIYPPSIAVAELDEFLADREERLRHDFPYLVLIAPDLYHKADVSGGMWYNVAVPAEADDPPLNDEWHDTTLVGYLEEAVAWGGFPGPARCPGHTWPIDELVRGLGCEKRGPEAPWEGLWDQELDG